MSHDTEKLHGPVFGTAHTVAEIMENAKSRVDASVADAAKDQRIRDLEREVERLKGQVDDRVGDLIGLSDPLRMDRADAERFRWLVENYGDIALMQRICLGQKGATQSEVWDIRAFIDADRAKEGGETATGHADYDPPCTDCWDTGVTTQTERHCSCEAGMRRRVSDAAMAKEGEA